ncbi:hypothetical protein DFR43_1039 [Tepidicella xavieri]|uniref:Uncharacterized protein n=2 Tax=Tepidicella xavieri TaxID=360241 RepID=A0A4R6UC78_9BURK|nr:hypothetical protein DFR43_1039 [Tepidicella xavieri]
MGTKPLLPSRGFLRLMQSPQVRLLDSVTELTPHDQGCLAVTGSHGGLSAARYALAVKPLLTVFNDAGVGKEQAGIAALARLEAAHLAACTVSHESACIGQAYSTWTSGVVSHSNAMARALGIYPGMSVQSCAKRLRALEPPTDPSPASPG